MAYQTKDDGQRMAWHVMARVSKLLTDALESGAAFAFDERRGERLAPSCIGEPERHEDDGSVVLTLRAASPRPVSAPAAVCTIRDAPSVPPAANAYRAALAALKAARDRHDAAQSAAGAARTALGNAITAEEKALRDLTAACRPPESA